MFDTIPQFLDSSGRSRNPARQSCDAARHDPWDRQPEEPNRWYARFERYRLAGPDRSLLGTFNAERAEKGATTKASPSGAWKRASEEWRWRERAEAWDEDERHRRRTAQASEMDKMHRRHVRQSMALQRKALRGLRALEPDDLSAGEVLRCLVEAIKIERSARGQPEVVETQRLTGATFALSLEDVVSAQKELEDWRNVRWPSAQGEILLQGNPPVP
jgi:hypothetical protein